MQEKYEDSLQLKLLFSQSVTCRIKTLENKILATALNKVYS